MFRENGALFRSAVAWCRDHIANTRQPYFANDVNAAVAITGLTHLVTEKTGTGQRLSGMPTPDEFGRSCYARLARFAWPGATYARF